ncbi:hypothetical protein [Nitrosomonas cryotolerans]|uniref:hypothetical protein n=1 Tax=Nitrosomonas cryotolerans TaxID=44575 RepID=UPI001160D560|nr:hypothetical protein [Nitrosomonas cryotolerans]
MGIWKYLYRAVDGDSKTMGFLLEIEANGESELNIHDEWMAIKLTEQSKRSPDISFVGKSASP